MCTTLIVKAWKLGVQPPSKDKLGTDKRQWQHVRIDESDPSGSFVYIGLFLAGAIQAEEYEKSFWSVRKICSFPVCRQVKMGIH